MATKRYTVTMELEVEDNDASREYMMGLTHHIDKLIDPNEMDPIKDIHDVQVYLCDKDHVRELHRDHLAMRFNEALMMHTLACRESDSHRRAEYFAEGSLLCRYLFASLDKYIDDKLNQHKSHD